MKIYFGVDLQTQNITSRHFDDWTDAYLHACSNGKAHFEDSITDSGYKVAMFKIDGSPYFPGIYSHITFFPVAKMSCCIQLSYLPEFSRYGILEVTLDSDMHFCDVSFFGFSG